MPSLKEVRNRIKSIQSTQQITKAMKMVSAARLRKAQEATIQLRPYAQKLNELLTDLSSGSDALAENVFTEQREVKKVLIIVVTSDRGLCGPFNMNVIKAVNSLIAEKYATEAQNKQITFLCIGKKGLEYFSRRYNTIISEYATLFTDLSFEKVQQIAERVMDNFKSNDFDSIELVYNEFKNVATQIVRKEVYLPFSSEITNTSSKTEYIFEPSVESILTELVPKSLKIKLYKAVLESNASEHGARMTAMEKATDNAGELLKALRLVYNRSRQASITKEILEIVGGAEALAAKYLKIE
jgi:F-type H+-transporting ATPase subunit gamma